MTIFASNDERGAAALLLIAYRRRDDARTIVARVAPLIVVALMVNWTFLRDPLITRLHDAIVPAVTLGAARRTRCGRSTTTSIDARRAGIACSSVALLRKCRS